MQLKSVKLVGFKSFVDPTTIQVMNGMNGVVGPNGCGKSNIIDAVRWVIGERSAKQLRGQSMSDVIFNGTSGRKPVGRASVELLFDNSDGSVVGDCASFAEISIKREVFRDGQSSYYLNGTACRRQDIVDIFYGTGLGSRSYAIIEQGMISRLIEAKPEDLRNHLEEAAGISKYKQRRHDTENRMARTEENLSRLMDLRDELDKQLKHLQRQASAAERYKVLREEERKINAEIKALHWKKWQAEFEKNHDKLQLIENERERLHAIQHHAERDLEKCRADQIVANDQYHAAQKEFYSIGGEIARVEQEIKYTQDQLERWKRELENTTSRFDELSESASEYEMQITELSEELEALRPQALSLSDNYRAATAVLADAEKNMQVWNESWESYQSRYADSSKALEVSRTKSLHYSQERQQLAARLARLKETQNAEQAEQIQLDIMPLKMQLDTYHHQRTEYQYELESILNQIQEKKSAVEVTQKNINDKRGLLQTQVGRKASLEALQEAAFCAQDKSVANWLTEHQLINSPRLGKNIKVTAGWELAVETVLKGLFDAVCIDGLDSFIDRFTPPDSGELMLLETAQQSCVSSSASFISLASCVVSEWPVAEWLGNVFIVDSLDQAKSMRHQLLDHQSLITREGIWLGKHWLRVAKTIKNEDSLLLRDQEITALTESSLQLKNDLLSLEETLCFLKEALVELERRREECHRKTQSLNSDITKTQSQLTEKETRYDALMQQQQAIAQEMMECHQRDADLQDQLTDMLEIIAQYEIELTDFDSKKEQLLAQKNHYLDVLNMSRQKAQEAKQRADEYDIRLSSNESQLAVLQQTMAREARQLNQLSEQRDNLSERLSHADDPLHELREKLQEQLELRSQFEQALLEATQLLETCNHKMAALEKEKGQAQLELERIQATYQQLQMDQQGVIVRQTTLTEQLQELQVTLDALLDTLPLEATLQAWEERAVEIASRITRLGPINLAAIEEHDTLKERKEYIDKQHADLEEALSILKNAIHKIDKETRGKFKETFDKVNQGFQYLFPKIFGGGNAALELDNDDFLVAGVVVKAQPPGKRNSTIHMLSGGEKALTAIALVFALFQLNPAPFCILDEVDAPLDDLNVGRYCRLISEMSAKIQFIVISHNKVTIEACDRLMGITMQEPGVSRVVSVDIDEAVSLVEA